MSDSDNLELIMKKANSLKVSTDKVAHFYSEATGQMFVVMTEEQMVLLGWNVKGSQNSGSTKQ